MEAEYARLEELKLYQILDTDSEEAFDRLTLLAAELFSAPIALVSLVDGERQWFKSRYGLATQATPRSWAFCAHAIQLDPGSAMVVEDAACDPRFRENPLVLNDPGIRFYAGAVLTSPNGANLGTLCVIDTVPRGRPSEKDLKRLKTLAAIVVDELELRRAKNDWQEAETRLSHALEQANAANNAKSVFLATMSHEIRTPLNGILGMAQAMSMDELSPTQSLRAKVISRSGEALMIILNDILDLAKIEAGKFELEAVNFELEDLADSVAGIFEHVAEAANNRFISVVEPEAAGLYNGDPTRVRQILSNLVSNALKFTQGGEVSMVMRLSGAGLDISVKDSGIGMTDGQIEALFGKFVQADATITRRFGGTGLGLTICSELATMMGGSIRVESQLGQGSIFTVSLPLTKLSAHAAPSDVLSPASNAIRELPGRPLRILTAEDNETNQLVIEALLAHIGVKPHLVANGAAAVDAWQSGDWDLILMDVQMPEMDGLTATRIIRERERAVGRRPIPIIALTANAMEHQVRSYREAGMDGFVAKPINVGELFAAIEIALELEAV